MSSSTLANNNSYLLTLADKGLRFCRHAQTSTTVPHTESGLPLIAAARKSRRQPRRNGDVRLSVSASALRKGRGKPGLGRWKRWEESAARPTKALILGYASLWFALLEGRKLFELRRHAIKIPSEGLRLLLICNKAMRKRFGLSCRMAEGICYTKIGPFSAEQIIRSPKLRGGVLATDDEIRKLLPSCAGRQTRGYLYCIVGVRMSKATWEGRLGNGSNCQTFFDQICGILPRWKEE